MSIQWNVAKSYLDILVTRGFESRFTLPMRQPITGERPEPMPHCGTHICFMFIAFIYRYSWFLSMLTNIRTPPRGMVSLTIDLVLDWEML
jgi:hypothetical protein